MTKLLLAVHVLAAIVAVGPVAVAAGMFPAVARRAAGAPVAAAGAPGPGVADDGYGALPPPEAVLRTLHRVCRVYTVVAVVVPVSGLATARSLHVLGDAWLITSMVLSAAAAGVLALLVLPGQRAVLDGGLPGPAGPHPAGAGAVAAVVAVDRPAAVRLAGYTGAFNLLWATVTVLMVLRPGSTAGA